MQPRYPLASVDRALSILQLLRTQPAIRLSDLARELGVANSTAHRLLAALAYRGFVRQDPLSRLYTAGPELVSIGRSTLLHLELQATSRPLLEELSATLNETTHLGVREGNRVRYLEAVEPQRALRVASRAGGTMPAHWTSTGKMLLAGLPDDTVRRLYGTTALATATDTTIADIDALLEELDRCRRHGYAISRGESDDDMVAVAIPLYDAMGDVAAAVSCAGPVHRLPLTDADTIADRMRAIVAGSSHAPHGLSVVPAPDAREVAPA